MTTAKNQIQNLPYVLFLGATASMGGMMFGFDLAIIVGAGPFLMTHFGLGDLGLGWAYSSLLFGCVAGTVLAGRLTDRFGRRKLLLFVALLFLLTSLATGMAPTFFWFVVARLTGGLAVGAVSVLSPLYIAEVAPPSIRGRMGAAYQMAITLGILLSYCLNYWLRNTGEWNWRWMFISGAIPSALFFLALLFAPETPRFLFKARRRAEGTALLHKLMSKEEADLETVAIESSLTPPSVNSEVIRTNIYRRVLWISFAMGILIHVSGINTIIDYAPLVLKSAGWHIDATLFSTFIIGGVNCLFTLISFWTIDRNGRKPLYLTGSIGMAVALAMIAVALSTGHASGLLLLTLMAIFIAFFASCIGPVFWTLVPEIFPNQMRGRYMVVPVVTQWVANAMVVLLFPVAFHQFGKVFTFAFLCAMAALQALFTWRYLPETKGKSLEEIEDFWRYGRGGRPRGAS